MLAFKDARPPRDEVATDYRPGAFRSRTIVIDNGSGMCRAGWSHEEDPRLVFDAIVSKPHSKTRDGDRLAVGNDVSLALMSGWKVRYPTERGVVTHFDSQEHIFDHVFSKLGVSTEQVAHPIMLTECVCNPNETRAGLSELLFEGYGVPSVCYGVDDLFSLYYNNKQALESDALVVSSGYHGSYVLPVLGGAFDARNCKRIDVAGYDIVDYMLKRLCCLNPGLSSGLSFLRAKELVEDHSYVADDFALELGRWQDPTYRQQHTRTFQLPFVKPAQVLPEHDEEKEERRRRNTQRLLDAHAQRDADKLSELTSRLTALHQVLSIYEEEGDDSILIQSQYENEADLKAEIEAVTAKAKRLETRLNNRNSSGEKEETGSGSEEQFKTPDFSLVGRPDAELSEAQLAEKRKQVMIKRLWDGRMRAKAQQNAERAVEDRKRAAEEQFRQANPDEWLSRIREEQKSILEKKEQRERRKRELSNRHSKAAKIRMRLLVQQADDTQRPTKRARKAKEEGDTFGADDDDWEVYREIARDADATSDVEAEDQRLAEIEEQLQAHAPGQLELTYEERLDAAAKESQLHLGAERVQAPEILFQPSLVGADQAGLMETTGFVLRRYSPQQQAAMCQNVFITGGSTRCPNFVERFTSELRAIRPFRSEFRVVQAKDPLLDAWKGARLWSLQQSFQKASVTLAKYRECGPDYLAEHRCSNVFVRPLKK